MGFRRLALALTAALAIGSVLIHAQVPGRNVNMVSGTALIDGDPFLQRQNEPSVAASTRNPLHLLAGSNDYRTVDLPFVNGAEETGDAWLGVFKSTDGGQRWTSTLLPGYPQDPNRAASPLGAYGAAADPVVRAGTNGLIYYAGLAFDRGANGKSGVFVARFIDNNNREKGDPIAFLGTHIVAADSGATGRFLDKPWLAVDMPRGGGGTCPVATTITKPPVTPGGTPTTEIEVHNLPAGPVYVAYSAFTGSGSTLRSDILFSSSTDCAVTWSAPQRLSAADDSINQGASIAIDPATGNVYVGWRRFTRLGSKTTDAMMVARSVNLGRRFAAPQAARRMPRGRQLGRLMEQILEHRKAGEPVEVEQLSEFDQGTSQLDISFRTNSYPTIAFDDKSRLYMAWAERGFSSFRPDTNDGDAKIVMSTSTNGTTWTAPSAVSEPDQPGHQIMPSLAFAGGKLLLVYYDLRETYAQVYGPYIDDKSAIQSSPGKRHTIDIRASLGTPGAVPSFAPSVRVSDYFIGHRPVPNPENFIPCPGGGSSDCEQLQRNPPNLPMFKQGTVPFFGDYIDITPAPAFVPAGKGGWTYNTAKNSVPVFHAVWTDNRDVRPPKAPNTWADYTPPYIPGVTEGTSVYDPTKQVGVCVADNTGMRNQNIYTARITGGLLVGSPANTKPLSTDLQRGFVVFAQNMTDVTKTFRMQIVNQPIGGYASFQQVGTTPLTFVDVITPPRSTASRTVYVTSSDEHARVNVDVFEIDQVGASQPTADGLRGVIILNADIENADIENADIENADIENADIENTEVTSADIENPTLRTADIENADIENADIENADIENADIENADIENADIENADIENTDFANAPIVDETWSVTNTGNTTTAFNVNMFLAQMPTTGVNVQLILHKSYLTPAAATCDLKLRSNTVLVANIINPVFVTPDSNELPDPNSPSSNNATLWLGPGETGKFTLRIRDTDPTNNVIIINDQGQAISVDSAFVPGVTVDPIVVAQEIGTADLAAGVTEPPITTVDGSTMFFLQQPVSSPAGVVMAPVRVQVRDKSGAVLPGIDVTMTLGTNPTGTALGGVTTVQTGPDGVALFDTLQISVPGDGYRLRATATQGGSSLGIAPIDSLPFSIRIVVLNTNDAGAGSLREAILLSNANAGVRDVVSFAIPGPGPHTITLQSPLPGIDDPAVIDATPFGVCTGAAPVVEIDGAAAGLSHGLVVNAPGTVVRGLAITNFATGFAGIFIGGGFGSFVECSYLGLAPDGATVKGNYDGLRITGSSGNTVGGTVTAARNVISGNAHEGIEINGPASGVVGSVLQTLVQGNFIGTDASGMLDRGNGANGVHIVNAAYNTISGNVISGNTGEGVRIDGEPAINNLISFNYIGTDATGTAALGNSASGIYIRRAPNNAVYRNVISGNTGFAGVTICGEPTFCGGGDFGTQGSNGWGTAIQANLIGTNATGTAAIANVNAGVSIDGAPQTLIGGDVPADGNVIAGNGGSGIHIFNVANANIVRANHIGTDAGGTLNVGNAAEGVLIESGSDNTVSGRDNDRTAPNVIMFNGGAGISVAGGTRNKLRINQIEFNNGLGIDLDNAGVTPNDPLDADPGPNDLQNAPIVTSATVSNTGTVSVQGKLNSTPNTWFTIDFYASTACDASGFGEGRQWFGAFAGTTDPAGNLNFNAAYGGGVVGLGQLVTAVATTGDFITTPSGTGSTSEFSNCQMAVAPGMAFWAPAAGGNGHVYEYVITPGTWQDAKTAAQGRAFRGVTGHLVSITGPAENDIVQNFQFITGDLRGWIGLTDEASEGTFTWITGEPVTYTNWAGGEPSNSGGVENYVEIFAAGVWNDNTNATGFNQGYVVEYEVNPFQGAGLSDPAGDAGGGPDLISATAVNTGTNLVFKVRFAPGTFNAATTLAQIMLDTDRSAATGHPGVNAGCITDAGILGSEYLVDVLNTTATIKQYSGTCNQFSFVTTIAVTATSDGYDVTVPLADIGGDDGVVNFKLTTSTELSPGAYTPVQDVMSNPGLPPGTTAGGS